MGPERASTSETIRDNQAALEIELRACLCAFVRGCSVEALAALLGRVETLPEGQLVHQHVQVILGKVGQDA